MQRVGAITPLARPVNVIGANDRLRVAIYGVTAGKDVYVAKPCSHNLWEGQQPQRYSSVAAFPQAVDLAC